VATGVGKSEGTEEKRKGSEKEETLRAGPHPCLITAFSTFTVFVSLQLQIHTLCE
jgi:hypothetical protein